MGKVSIDELQQKRHPEDTAAIAAVLYNKGQTTLNLSTIYGFVAFHEFEVRIKIYKKEGMYLADYEVPFYAYQKSDKDNIEFFDAYTYNLVDGKIIKTKVKHEAVFYEEIESGRKKAKITFPNVREGSVIEFRYSLRSQNIQTFPPFKFQKDIPVNYAEYKTAIPIYFIYKPVVKGFLKVTTENKTKLNYQKGDFGKFVYQQMITTHTLSNIPALKNEDFVDNIDNYVTSINYELVAIKKPGSPIVSFAKTWDDVAITVWQHERFGKEIKKQVYFEKDIENIIKNLADNEEKIQAIFSFVQNKMTSNRQEGIFSRKGVETAYSDNDGNPTEINFILISMLRAAGINANPVLVSTVENGIADFPNIASFNNVIAAIKNPDKIILLDASNKHTTPGVLQLNALNWSGRLINRDGTSEQIKMIPSSSSKFYVTAMVDIDKTGKISGKIRFVKTDYEAFIFRELYTPEQNEKYLEGLESNMKGIEISDYVLQNQNNLSQPINESFNFTSNNLSEVIGERIYINPMLFFSGAKNPFVNASRKLPIYFGYPRLTKFAYSIKIPENYMVEAMPENLTISTGDDIAKFQFSIQQNGNTIQIVVSTEVSMMLVASDFYPVLKDYYKKLVDKQNEKIILKKIKS